jgi:hypothetical protein
MNKPAVNELNRALKNCGDSPERVAGQIIQTLRRNAREAHLGFPERFLAWLNGVAPALIDRGLAGKLPIIKQHASSRH